MTTKSDSKVDFKTESKKPEKPAETEVKPVEPSEKAKILAEYGGIESNVPINHPTYWGIKE